MRHLELPENIQAIVGTKEYSLDNVGMSYTLMTKIDGKMLCSVEYLEQPEKLINLAAQGLKQLWKIDVKDCPYQASRLNEQLKNAEKDLSDLVQDKLDNDTEDKISSEVTTIQNTQSVQKSEDNVIQNVMSSMGEIKDMLSMLHKNVQTQSDELKNIKDTQDDIKSNQIKQHSDLQDIQYNQIRNQQQNQNTLDRMEYNQNKHNRKLDLIRQRQDPDINIIN